MISPKQKSHVFILGKNWKLSTAELVSFLKARNHKFKITGLSKTFAIVTSEGALDASLIDDLGGTIKIGKIRSSIPLEIVEDAFLHRKKEVQAEVKERLSADHVVDEVFKMPMQKCVFGVSLYFEDSRFLRFSKEIQRFLGSYFKEELVSRGVRAKFMGFPKKRQLPQLTHVEVLKKDLIGKSAEILFCIGTGRAFASNTLAVHNPFEFQKRDVGRPVQRRIFSIPPRLAKIMANLSACLPGKVLLDPFCGVGTILQEALLLKARVIGVDINPWCVKAAKTNLDWLSRQYVLKDASYTILLGDARSLANRISEESVDCIVTEPDLGPALRHFPTEFYAKRLIDKVKPLYFDFLKEAYKTLKADGTVVFVTPYVKTRQGNFVNLNIEERAGTIGFKMVCPFDRVLSDDALLIRNLVTDSSFVDIGERHKIGREIHILQK